MSNINWNDYNVQNGGEKTDRSFPEKGKELEVGQGIEGELLEIKSNVGPNKSNIYVLKTKEGDKVGVWGSTVIDGRLDGVKIGQSIAIEYLGVTKGKTGKNYKDFKIGVGFLVSENPQVTDTDQIDPEEIPF